jgi:hypothetical protein
MFPDLLLYLLGVLTNQKIQEPRWSERLDLREGTEGGLSMSV